jgi:hypothetical protein
MIFGGALAAMTLTGCGGGDGGSLGSGMAYVFVTPVLNSSLAYSETIVDNSNNTIDISWNATVTAVNGDGSYTVQQLSTTTGSAIVNGTNYAAPDETESYNPIGQETGYTDLSVSPALTCTFDPHGTGPDWPVKVGQTWSLDYTFTCGTAAAIAYTQQGTVVDVESVTVPAGTFTALKLASTVTWTDAQGTTRTQTVTNWRDVATSRSVKQTLSIAVSGSVPTTGYAVSRTLLLESIS